MKKQLQLRLLPSQAADDTGIRTAIAQQTSVKPADITGYDLLRKSIDARGRNVFINLTLQATIGEAFHPVTPVHIDFKNAHSSARSVIIVGAGPAGLFAALRLLEDGIRPIILERGKDVQSRRRDLAILNREGIVNPESNYCFGEGGAGTYSDGKLYTRSNKRGDIKRILNLFVQFGAGQHILYEAHPHIGTNKLPGIIQSMRECIISHGGEIYFNEKLTGLSIENGAFREAVTASGNRYRADALILATGHSARDIFRLCHTSGISIEAKPFALGVRIEHPQVLIDSIQYHRADRGADLPPASYGLVQQVYERGVFSFCMCPGGIIAPAATEPERLVVNGWSPSKRNNPFANSGMVVEIKLEDVIGHFKDPALAEDPLAFMHFQDHIEASCFNAGGGKFVAPASRMEDFCKKKISTDLPPNSYLPGLKADDLSRTLPSFVYQSLAEGFKIFGKKLKGFYTNDAVVVATESRTSSPVRIPRDAKNLHHPLVRNFYPCGEGAGYAGGIVSAAMDGELVASACIRSLKS
jgi:uncharacterized FAD-dependent dehydrogenase